MAEKRLINVLEDDRKLQLYIQRELSKIMRLCQSIYNDTNKKITIIKNIKKVIEECYENWYCENK